MGNNAKDRINASMDMDIDKASATFPAELAKGRHMEVNIDHRGSRLSRTGMTFGDLLRATFRTKNIN